MPLRDYSRATAQDYFPNCERIVGDPELGDLPLISLSQVACAAHQTVPQISPAPFQRQRFRISLGAVAESISGKLADIVLPESGGTQVRLGSLWENNPAAIVFLRHYG